MGLEFKDMVDMIKPTIHIDEFESKVGEDDAYIVLSFFVTSEAAADDLVHWFETGYDFVIDADKSEGEIEINRFLVFVEVLRRTRVIAQISDILEDLGTLTDYEPKDWRVNYDGDQFGFDPEVLEQRLILSPQDYREIKEIDLNEMRVASGLPVKNIYNSTDDEMNAFRTLANLPIKR